MTQEVSTIPDGNLVAGELRARLDKERNVAAQEMATQLVAIYLSRSDTTLSTTIAFDASEHLTGLAEKYRHDVDVHEQAVKLLALKNWTVLFRKHWNAQVEMTPRAPTMPAESAMPVSLAKADSPPTAVVAAPPKPKRWWHF